MCPSGHRRRHRSRRAPDDQGAVTIDDREFLMIPGPVSVDETVLEALARPVRAHYGDGWTQLYKQAVSGMRDAFKTDGEVHLVFGSGMAPVAVGPRALEALSDGRPKAAGWYLNLATWRRYAELWSGWHPHPTTMPTNVVEAFDVALTGLLEEGVERRWTRLARARDRVREGLGEMGFEMLSPLATASPVTTAAYGLPGMDLADYMAWLLREHRIRIGGGLGELSGKIFRIGHMGRAAEPEAIDRYLRATADYVDGHGLGRARG